MPRNTTLVLQLSIPLRWAFSSVVFMVIMYLSITPIKAAEGDARVYLPANQFLANVFGETPSSAVIWLDEAARQHAQHIANEDPGFRKRYWQAEDTLAWIVDVIGKSHPITVGVVTGPEGIQDIKVLVYRESRGWEIRQEFFTRQFIGATLDGNHLSKEIDSITGATLSVRAMKRAARLALWGQQRVQQANTVKD